MSGRKKKREKKQLRKKNAKGKKLREAEKEKGMSITLSWYETGKPNRD